MWKFIGSRLTAVIRDTRLIDRETNNDEIIKNIRSKNEFYGRSKYV